MDHFLGLRVGAVDCRPLYPAPFSPFPPVVLALPFARPFLCVCMPRALRRFTTAGGASFLLASLCACSGTTSDCSLNLRCIPSVTCSPAPNLSSGIRCRRHVPASSHSRPFRCSSFPCMALLQIAVHFPYDVRSACHTLSFLIRTRRGSTARLFLFVSACDVHRARRTFAAALSHLAFSCPRRVLHVACHRAAPGLLSYSRVGR